MPASPWKSYGPREPQRSPLPDDATLSRTRRTGSLVFAATAACDSNPHDCQEISAAAVHIPHQGRRLARRTPILVLFLSNNDGIPWEIPITK